MVCLCPKRSPVFQTWSSFPLFRIVAQFPLSSQDQSPWPILSFLPFHVDSEHKSAKVAQSGRVVVLTSSSMELFLCFLAKAFLPLELKFLGQQIIKFMRTGSKNFANGLLGIKVNGATLIFTLLISGFLNPGWETESYIRCWLRAYRAFWRTLPQPWQAIPPSWLYNQVFKKLFHCSIKLAASGWWGTW